MARKYTSWGSPCLSATSFWPIVPDKRPTRGEQEDREPTSIERENLRISASFLLTPKMMERSIRFGWSKVVGSGSNLVANDHFGNFSKEATRQFSNGRRYAARKLHGPDRCEGSAKSADAVSPPHR